MEAMTSWLFVHLASFAEVVALEGHCSGVGNASAYLAEAALVNLFPSNGPEERQCPRPPKECSGDAQKDLLEAILCAEPREALHAAQDMAPEQMLPVLAEAACDADRTFNAWHHLLAVASAAELMPQLRPRTAAHAYRALAKSLANR
jgi:hypothetical protein